MKTYSGKSLFVLLLIVVLVSTSHANDFDDQLETNDTLSIETCFDVTDSHHLCYCGDEQIVYDLFKKEKCVDGRVVWENGEHRDLTHSILRPVKTPIYRSTRDDFSGSATGSLWIKRNSQLVQNESVPLRNITVETWINNFAADVTINQVFVNEERKSIEAIYVFPIEENAAIYSFTAQIGTRTITAELKEKTRAEQEYKTAVSRGQTAVLLRQSEQTLDTFTINVGSLGTGEICVITIKYVSELEMVDGSSIRFVVPTTISPRYNPQMGGLQSPDRTPAKYTQKTPYALSFQAHVARGDQYRINHIANLSHPVDANISRDSIDISMSSITLDRDIIIDIDLPSNRPAAFIRIETDPNTLTNGVLFAFTPRLSHFVKIAEGYDETTTEFIFIVDCSGSMTVENRIPLAREAMLLFIRSLPLDAHFNIIRFGSNYDVLFKSKMMTEVYNETTAKKAEDVIRSMKADFGGTEILEPLKYLKQRPPALGRSRQVFILTDGEVSNTDKVIELCRSMSTSTRIFSFGLGDSPSRSLVKGLARATNGHFTFIPPNAKVDSYVASHFSRALQPSIVNARLEWHGFDVMGQQAPKMIPPLYVNDRVLVYQLFDQNETLAENITVDVVVGNVILETFDLPVVADASHSTIRRLAAKALIQELVHAKSNLTNDNSQEIKKLSLEYQILSPYTAFVGIEQKTSTGPRPDVRYVPIQVNKDYESSSSSQGHGYSFGLFGSGSRFSFGGSASSSSSYHKHHGVNSGGGGGGGFLSGGIFRSIHNNPIKFIQRPLPMKEHFSFSDSEANRRQSAASTTTVATIKPTDASDRVRWLIDRQSYNGAWIFLDQDIPKFTNGKMFHSFKTTNTHSRNIITTALAISVLESEHSQQSNLWFAIVNKARKYLQREGLTADELDELIDEIKDQL